MYRDDYARDGIRMLPVIEPDGESTAKRIVACSILLIPISLTPRLLGMTGSIYAAAAVAAGSALLRSASWPRPHFCSRAPRAAGVRFVPATAVSCDGYRPVVKNPTKSVHHVSSWM
jgi:hypothetical protein